MSFYINNNNQNRPCSINSQGLNAVCEKALIRVDKVFDACLSRDEGENFVLLLTDFVPQNPNYPLTFVSADSIPYEDIVVSNVSLNRIESKPNFANVSVSITIPIQVNFTDNAGQPGIAKSSITITKDVILFMPQNSLSNMRVDVSAYFSSQIGSFSDDTTLNVNGCLQVIVRIVAKVDLLVPSFGYPCLPPCQVIDSEPVCNAFFNQPIYPN